MMKRFLGFGLFVSVLILVSCGGSPLDQFNAWVPKFTSACQKSAEIKALIKATDSVDEKMKIKKEKLDGANQTLGDLQKELKGIMNGLDDTQKAKAKTTVQEILTQYGIS